ncbi:MAG: 30S ribosomal protein S19 [Planctomycetota bacterium]|jgi:small subunit ribosomal protein S19|nr:MAG: 30S ribosomal protein S19 [Planctomycetota bacterium]
MSRSTKKGPFVDEKLYRKAEKMQASERRTPLKTYKRSCTIVPEFVGLTFQIHNGKSFLDCFVTEDMVGHKLGEFSPTRVFRGHTNKKEGLDAGPGMGAGAGAGAGGGKGGDSKKK